MIKKIWLVVGMVFMFLTSNVNAATYQDKFDENWFYIDNEFVNKTKNGSTKYQQMSMIVRKSDNSFAYCIEPGKSIDESTLINGYDKNYTSVTNLTPQQWERIKLLAFYGYGYEGHLDIKWYVITQFMIWQTNNLGYDIYFTDKLNGNKIEKYTEEMIELDNLVNGHYVLPKFEEKEFDLFWGETKSFKDKNNVLNKFNVKNGNDIESFKNNNTINITSKNYGQSYIIFQKQEKRFFRKHVIYVDSNNQDLLVPGDLDNLTHRMSINMQHGSVNVNKLDYDTKSNQANHEGILENAVYGLYDNSNNLLEIQSTNSEGSITFNTKLSSGRYYVLENSPSIGYTIDNTKYYFDITKDNYKILVNVYEKVIKENFEIIKVLDDSNTGLLEFEKGIEFGVYNVNNELIKKYITSELGTIKFSLPYGRYILRQHNSYDGYEKIEDYEIIVQENDKENKLVFKDNLIKYKVKLNVKNKDTLENIKDIKFELYDKDDNKICYKINDIKEMCEYISDEDGNVLFPQNFKFDKYYIRLIHNDNFKYIYKSDLINFEINNTTNYKEEKDYRLIELEYFLEEEKIQNSFIEEKNEQKELEQVDKEFENKIKNNEYVDSKIDLPEIEEGLVVKVPNTLKNKNNNLIYFIIICVIVIKKLL